MIARRILPWFGGSAAVWSTCLVFYQVALLAGYFYARLLGQYLRPRAQAIAHIGLLAFSLLLLPIGPGPGWRLSAAQQHPAWHIFRMLSATVGLPFVALSASTPLLQAWLARARSELPYWLFALSNLASLVALLSYPLLVEPLLGARGQSMAWSASYVVYAVCCGALSVWQARYSAPVGARAEREAIPTRRILAWFALAACGSMLLLSVTNHLDENVAAIPLLWVLPLAVYLLSFVVTFGSRSLYKRALWLRLFAFAIGVLAYAIYDIDAVMALAISLPVFLSSLFVCCVFCHGELNRLRPPAEQLTGFYLAIAGGGATGAIAVGLAAPVLFSGVYELPLAVCATTLLALILTWPQRLWAMRLLWAGGALVMAAVAVMNFNDYHANALSLRRSFYGSLRVVQTPRAGIDQQRILFHGTIEHGAQFVQAPRREQPTTYYAQDSGIGIVLREGFHGPKRVGVVGLGTGTLAAYGKAADTFRFYEINPQVVDAAQSLFYYWRETPARISDEIGDGRLALEREKDLPYHVLVLDAFSGDAIPIHLLTREAMLLYSKHISPNGVIAFHVSNDYLDLAPVVQQLATAAGYRAVLVHNHSDSDEAILPADWMLVTNNTAILENEAIRVHAKPISPRADRLWTDDYSNVWGVFRTPALLR